MRPLVCCLSSSQLNNCPSSSSSVRTSNPPQHSPTPSPDEIQLRSMTLHAGSHASSSIPSSGRSSPIPRRRLDDDPTRKDPKYKRFSASIDRALALFEGNQEWADYISFLGRLLKALQSHPSLPLIPSKHLVAQRLAQCLNPRLPAGVHQKTIQLYAEIFRLIGREGLIVDLALWTPGLAPVLSFASLNTKPPYLELLEKYYLPLGSAIRPALKSIILALLPGIDEEGGEYFEKTLQLLDAFRKNMDDDAYFWQCLMLATITSPERRPGALVFLSKRLPKLGGAGAAGSEGEQTEKEWKQEVETLLNPEPGLLVRALCAGLADEQLLVQRAFLDLLVTHIPLSSEVIQNRVSAPDLQLLVTSAAGVVLRRDMGLNRRLWTWFLGTEEGKTLEYFRTYGARPLIGGMLEMIQHTSDSDPDVTPAERARPYRICLSLMDRWEVGSEVVQEVFLPAIENLRTYEIKAGSAVQEQYAEVANSANTFFDGVEASLIWKQILEKVDTAFVTGDKDSLETIRFVLRTFNVRDEEEMTMIHAPIAVLAILLRLENSNDSPLRVHYKEAVALATDIWGLVPEAAFKKTKSGAFVTETEDDILESIQAFYAKQTSRPTDRLATTAAPFLPPTEMARQIFNACASLLRFSLDHQPSNIVPQARLFIQIADKTPLIQESCNIAPLVESCLKWVDNDEEPVSFAILHGIAGVVTSLQAKQYLQKPDLNILVASIVHQLWNHYLSPDSPKFHVESVKILWNLQRVLGERDRSVEAAISTAMTKNDVKGFQSYSMRPADQGRRFAVLWMHSVNGTATPVNAYHMMLTRPLFLLLDSLADDSVEMSVFTRGWLQNLPSLNRLFWIFVAKLLELDFLKDPGRRDANGAPITRPTFRKDDELELGTYYFRTLANILKNATEGVMATLASELVVNGDEFRRRALSEKRYGDEDMSLQMFFARASLRAIEGDPLNQQPDSGELDRVSKLHQVSLSVLHHLLLSTHSKSLAEMALEEAMTARLISMMKTPGPATYIQVALLDVLHAALKLSSERPTSHLGQLRMSRESMAARTIGRLSTGGDTEKPTNPLPQFTPPQQLLKCLLSGFSNLSSRPVLDSWMFFLAECLPLFEDVIIQMLLPLVESLCEEIKKTFQSLQIIFRDAEKGEEVVLASRGPNPENTLVALLSGLEEILAAAHRRLLFEEHHTSRTILKSPDSSSGFFGSMVSGVFSVEGQQSRSAAANNRLTVLLCFQDTVKLCYSIWSWADVVTTGVNLDPTSRESWQHTSLKMKARSRKILEHMFAAETLQCLETLVELWPGRLAPYGERNVGSSIFKLVNVLDGSRPKHTIPAIFHAIYSRTNASALEVRSTLTAELSEIDVVVFLVEYARSLEDDAMDEIWTDCIMFIKDVLANPFPHRQTLPSLLAFTAVIGGKVDNTNFGEQRRLRRELADLFQRLLAVTFTTAPLGQRSLEPPAPTASSTSAPTSPVLAGPTAPNRPLPRRTQPDDVVPILASILQCFRAVLLESDRILTACTTISTSLLTPTFRAKYFPTNISPLFLSLLLSLTKMPNIAKAWKPALSDALNDPRLFSMPPNLVQPHLVPVVRQYLTSEREHLPSLLARITPPTTAGVLFGVGATSARLEADRKTQLNLKRIVLAFYSASNDFFLPALPSIEDKIVELLNATFISSPSSSTRVELYLLIRILLLRVSPVHLSGLWPILSVELQNALMALWPDNTSDMKETYHDLSILAACKLIDTLLVVAPDEWQLMEWLFVTNTSEAVWSTSSTMGTDTVALIDVLKTQVPVSSVENTNEDEKEKRRWGRRMWFKGGEGREETLGSKADVLERWVAPWLRAVSAEAYEGTYRMGKPDLAGCEEAVVKDLFSEMS